MNIDVAARQSQATTITEELIGGEALHRLAQGMLDHEIPPAFLWRGIVPPLNVEAEALQAKLELAVESNGKMSAVRSVLAGMPGLDRDPTKALLQLATSHAYFEIPETLLGLPSKTSRVFSAIPQLAGRLDDRGLVHLTDLRATPRAVLLDGYALSYHQLLRRGFGSHVNDALLDYLLRLRRQMGLELRAAIDERRLRLAKDYREWVERDYWFGPHLTEEVLDAIDPKPTTLVHRWADPDDPRRLFDTSEEFTVRLTLDGRIRTVEAEELVVPRRAASGSSFILVRYLHAQRDISRRVFIHCDGAVRAYLPETYERRRNLQGLPRNDKDLVSRYRKLFRVDGDIATDEWSQIVALWFRGNHLALEALEGLATNSSPESAA